MSDDVVARADRVLEGVTPGPWTIDDEGISAGDRSILVPLAVDERFVAEARTLVPELQDEVVRLREAWDDHHDPEQAAGLWCDRNDLLIRIEKLKADLAKARHVIEQVRTDVGSLPDHLRSPAVRRIIAILDEAERGEGS